MIESLKKNAVGIGLMSFSALSVCIGQLFWKLSTGGNLYYLFLGFSLYGIGAIVMILAYRYGSLSVLQPMLSLNYVMSIILAKIVLNEQITAFKILGIVFIVFGVVLIGGGDE